MISRHQPELDAALAAAGSELASIRTGRANPSVLDHIVVLAYGATMPLRQLASVTVPDARVILITPWDKSVAKDIERAIVEAQLGLNPVSDGSGIRLVVPQLTSETRAELLKLVHGKIESARVRLRTVRDHVRDEITRAQRAGELTEDDRYAALAELDDVVKAKTAELTEMSERKVKEISTI